MLGLIDNITIAVAVAIIFIVIKKVSKQADDMDAYYRANNALPFSLAVGTIAASWYGGNGTIGTVGYVGTMGLAAWFVWSFGCHLSRFPLALWIAPRISVKINGTMVDLLERFYGRFAAWFGALVLVAGSLSLGELGAAGYVGVAAWGFDKFTMAIIVLVISIVLASMGGLMGVAITDMIFFFLMIESIVCVFPQALMMVGGMPGLGQALDAIDPGLMTAFGGMPWLKSLILIVLCVNMYKDPAFYQRFAASNGPKTGKRAMMVCFIIWICMDICLMLTGLILRAIDPEMLIQPEVHYIQLVLSYLPPVARGMFIVGMMGAIISTIDSYYLIGGEIMAQNVVNPVRAYLHKNPLSDKQSIWVCRVTMVCMGIFSLCVTFRFTRIYDATLLLNSMSMSALWIPVLGAILYNGKKTNVGGTAAMVIGVATWLYFRAFPIPHAQLGTVDPVLICVPVSLVVYVIGNRFGKELNRGFAPKEGIEVGSVMDVNSEAYKDAIKLDAFDGLMTLAYFGVGALIGYGLLARNTAIVLIAGPGVGGVLTAAMFFKYISEVVSYGKTGGKAAK